jgi:hypothetical protein
LRLAPDVHVRVATETAAGRKNRTQIRIVSARHAAALLRAHRPLQF